MRGTNKMTWEKVRQMRLAYELANPKPTFAIVAERFGVNRSTAYRIIAKKSWKEPEA
jgi:hypothetical protein